MNAPPAPVSPGEKILSVVARGDLSKLSDEEKAKYYTLFCESVGLNPLTRPLDYITLNNRLTLYVRKDGTDQLRSIHNVSVVELTESERDGVFIVTCKVANSAGRTDVSKGAVQIAGLRGEALANAIMKAETKAKRRATLSICGMGLLDESEIEDVPEVRAQRGLPAPPPVVTSNAAPAGHVAWEDPPPAPPPSPAPAPTPPPPPPSSPRSSPPSSPAPTLSPAPTPPPPPPSSPRSSPTPPLPPAPPSAPTPPPPPPSPPSLSITQEASLWLEELSNAFDSCETLTELSEQQIDRMMPRANRVPLSVWTQAETLMQAAIDRIQLNTSDE